MCTLTLAAAAGLPSAVVTVSSSEHGPTPPSITGTGCAGGVDCARAGRLPATRTRQHNTFDVLFIADGHHYTARGRAGFGGAGFGAASKTRLAIRPGVLQDGDDRAQSCITVGRRYSMASVLGTTASASLQVSSGISLAENMTIISSGRYFLIVAATS